ILSLLIFAYIYIKDVRSDVYERHDKMRGQMMKILFWPKRSFAILEKEKHNLKLLKMLPNNYRELRLLVGFGGMQQSGKNIRMPLNKQKRKENKEIQVII